MTNSVGTDPEAKIAVVTGASSGIGQATARRLAAEGYRVVAAARRRDRLDKLAAEVPGVRPVTLDVTDQASVDALAAAVPRCDVLVNNAGVVQTMTPLAQTSEEMFDRIYGINTKGPMHLAASLAQHMARNGGGTIVNIVTMGALRPAGHLGMYCSSKAAMVALTRSMADEWAASGIRVNAIAPGPFLTEMLDELEAGTPGFIKYSEAVTMLKRAAQPDEIIGPVLFLASEASSYVTGQTLSVCGGAI